jgi:hypothetical protein
MYLKHHMGTKKKKKRKAKKPRTYRNQAEGLGVRVCVNRTSNLTLSQGNGLLERLWHGESGEGCVEGLEDCVCLA